MLLYLSGSFFVLYLLLVEPYLRNQSRRSFDPTAMNARVLVYRNDFFRNLMLGLFVIFMLLSGLVSPDQLAMKHPDFTLFNGYPEWFKLALMALFLWFIFYYFIFVTVGVRLHRRFRSYLINKVKPVAAFAPQTFKEYLWWTFNSFGSAFEELAYRGFLFFFMKDLFPSLSLWIIAALSVLIESIRYAPRIAAMKYVAQRSLIFAIALVVSGSLYVPILLHIMYNLRIMAVPFHWALEGGRRA